MSFNNTLKSATSQQFQSGKLGLIELVRVNGIIRRAERGVDRCEDKLADARDAVCTAAVARGLMPAEGPGADFDWDKLLELIMELIPLILELFKFFA